MGKILISVLSILLLINCRDNNTISKNSVFVSIAPQKYFAEKIVGDKINVNVMVRPGFNPTTYEPLPRQLQKLQASSHYFTVGVPFEKALIPKFEKISGLKIVNTVQEINKRETESFELIIEGSEETHHDHDSENCSDHNHHNHNHEGLDPHVWLNPQNAKIIAKNIYTELNASYPEYQKQFELNLKSFINEMDSLTNEIKKLVETTDEKRFVVFHPSWGYFADEFGLKQIPIEVEGKEPSPQQLKQIIDFIKSKKLETIFIAEQFSTSTAEQIAKSINGKIVKIDPLSENYFYNLLDAAKKISGKNFE